MNHKTKNSQVCSFINFYFFFTFHTVSIIFQIERAKEKQNEKLIKLLNKQFSDSLSDYHAINIQIHYKIAMLFNS